MEEIHKPLEPEKRIRHIENRQRFIMRKIFLRKELPDNERIIELVKWWRDLEAESEELRKKIELPKT